MYKEFNKYKTGKTRPANRAVIVDECTFSFVVNETEYESGMGTLIDDFIAHKTKPFWKRRYSHRSVTKKYIEILNNITIRVYL